MLPKALQSYFRLAHTVGVDLLQSLDGLVAGGGDQGEKNPVEGKSEWSMWGEGERER